MFRGPDMEGKTTVTNLPVKWSAGQGRLWKTDLPGPGASQPVTKDGRIYVTAYSDYAEARGKNKAEKTDMSALKLHVVCLDSADGSTLWHKTLEPLGDVPEPTSNLAVHGYATPSPIIENGVLYVSFGPAGVFALSADTGDEKWKRVPGTITHFWGSAASLNICGDLLLVNASSEANALLALDKTTGTEKWRSSETLITTSKWNRSWATPMVIPNPAGGEQILLLGMSQLASINPADGSTLWTHRTNQGYAASNPIYHDGIIYAITGSGHGAWNSYALKPHPDLNRKERQIWHNKDNGTGFSSAVYLDGYIYYAAFTGKERPRSAVGFCCMKAKTGEMVYKVGPGELPEKLEDMRLGRRGNYVYGSVLYGDGKLYYPYRPGGVFVVEAKPKFNFLALNTFEDDDSWITSPLVPLAGGRLIIRTDKAIHCVGKE
jgi:outer membrane protein assembly factor BamB